MSSNSQALPGAKLDAAKMPGHWLLARLGKRVLRPGGLQLTKRMLDALDISADDRVIEFAPGLGITADLILAHHPQSYVAVERDEAAARALRQRIGGEGRSVINLNADASTIEGGCATVVCGEAMLSMQTEATKQVIVAEAFRLLEPGGRFAIHELSLIPDDIPNELADRILADLSSSIHIGARPATVAEWQQVLSEAGFTVERCFTAPMHLLRISRLFEDEGMLRAIRFLFNVATDGTARRRVFAMAKVFKRCEHSLGAVVLVARRPGA